MTIRFGIFIDPHGWEWGSLVRAAGFDPQVTVKQEDVFGLEERLRASQRLYEYYCPALQTHGDSALEESMAAMRRLPCRRSRWDTHDPAACH